MSVGHQVAEVLSDLDTDRQLGAPPQSRKHIDLHPAHMSALAGTMVDVPPDLPAKGELVGRADELALLARLTGVGQSAELPLAVLLSGDAGVGKTRLLSELRQLARSAGNSVLLGHCLDLGDSSLPYLPFAEAFGRVFADDPAVGRTLIDAQPALARLARVSPSGAGELAAPVAVDRPALFEAVHAGLERLAAKGPVLLVVEDIHWADQSTRELLSYLLARPPQGDVALVLSYRGDDLHRRHPLRATAAAWARLPSVRRMQLAPLGEADVRALVRVLHPEPLRETDMHAVVERADGNAFFVEELVAASELGHGSLPTELAELLLVRLDQLDNSTRQAVRAASAHGRRVRHDLLAQVVGLAPGELEEALRTAVERNVLVALDDDGYGFRHALFAEAVYHDLLPGERVRLHAAYATALARSTAVGPAAELARHARAAHDVATALEASIRAGDEAMALGGPDEAARHYEIALELVAESDAVAASGGTAAPASPLVDRVALTVKASQAVSAAGHPQRAIAVAQDALAGPLAAEPLQRARLLLALATAALVADTNVDALAASSEAMRLVPEDPPTALRAEALSVHARANADRLRHDDAARWAVEAIELGGRLQLPDVVADARTTKARLDQRRGDPVASRRALEGVITEARQNDDGPAELRGLHHLGGLHLDQGDLDAALKTYALGAARAREIGRPWAPYGLDARILEALVAFHIGDWDRALAVADVSGQHPPAIAEAAMATMALLVHAARGDSAGLDLLAQVQPWWNRDGMLAVHAAGAAIDLRGDAGDLVGALDAYDDVVRAIDRLWQQQNFQARIRLSGQLLAHVAAALPRAAAAQRAELLELADRLAEDARRTAEAPRGSVGARGPEGEAWIARVRAEHLRARWLSAIDPPDERDLVSAWRNCVAAFERYPQALELARSQVRLASVLRAVGEPGEARQLLDAARSTAHRLGAEPLLAELRQGGGAATRLVATTRGDALTPRETEILALVAQGRSNREVAGQLYISAKTVSVHVSNILAKLGAAGRTEAVAIARRRGVLVD